jgi:SAM-dependent methyltransferase
MKNNTISRIIKNTLKKICGSCGDQLSAAYDGVLAAQLNQLPNANLWWIDEAMVVSDGSIEISGWAIIPHDRRDNVAFTVNGMLFDEIKYPIFNPGLEKKYYFMRDSGMCGFRCIKHTNGTESVIKDNLLVCRIVDKETMVPFERYYGIHSQIGNMDDLPIPSDKHMIRIGAGSAQHYRMVGFDQFMRLQEALQKYANRTYGDTKRVLDWGCGCARVLRYFIRYKNIEVNGADIDSVNIEWCEHNLPFARFHQVPLSPPTAFADEYFDLIFGISVLTHLREQDQSAWLAELSRISGRGGIVMLSVHGNGGVAFRNELFSTDSFSEWQKKGFVAIGVDSVIDSINDKEYYTTSFQTDWYIRNEWSKYFEIVDIIPSYIGHFQDLVIMRKV